MDSAHDDHELPWSGCPIRRSPDQHLLSGFPELIAASHVLRRLLAPRHSPCALSSLTMLASGRPCFMAIGRKRLGELPRACSQLTDYPSRLSKNRARDSRLELRISTIPAAVRRTATGIAHGADGDRTHDLRLAKPALSQLSYSPERTSGCPAGVVLRRAGPRFPVLGAPWGCPRQRGPSRRIAPAISIRMLPPRRGFDRARPYSHVHAANQLGPWWAQVESNYRPRPYQGRALAD